MPLEGGAQQRVVGAAGVEVGAQAVDRQRDRFRTAGPRGGEQFQQVQEAEPFGGLLAEREELFQLVHDEHDAPGVRPGEPWRQGGTERVGDPLRLAAQRLLHPVRRFAGQRRQPGGEGGHRVGGRGHCPVTCRSRPAW
ncbi:hypothetical protein C7M71_012770 [Peterkaempfera bronchialis]|uniref:Uncharacterized protein n=1 Tax=Peterkaempfera bronchialis TaxID=2126346 RepID=A0A345SWS9_9ACTN|nr:hypothetical protein C7M71_012770 [Peterkaempfera bronchialis]